MDLLSRPTMCTAPSDGHSRPIRIGWQYAAFARSYKVAIATDSSITSVIKQLTVPRNISSILTELTPGSYWVRVEAINPQGSALSAIHPLVVSPAPLPLHVIHKDGFE